VGSLLTGLLGNGVLAVALFMSIYMAAGWGEMAGIRGGGDKSGLGGLFAMLMLMGIRWAAVALLLLLAVWRGLFDFLPGGRWPGVGIVLGAHLLLGLVSYLGFNWVAEGLTADRFGPQRWSPLFGILLPLPALFVAGWAVNRDFLARHPRLGLVLAVAIALGHVALYRQRYESMRRPPQAVRVEHSLPSS
jgi:hypothetical protein